MQNLISWIAFGLILWVVYSPIRSLTLEFFRQAMFSVRGEVFDLAMESEEIGFDDDIYTVLIDEINMHIRFLHQKGVVEFLILGALFFDKFKDEAQPKSKFLKSLNKVKNEKLKEKLAGYHYQIIVSMVSCMVLRSPLFFILLFISTPFIILYQVIRLRFYTDLRVYYDKISSKVEQIQSA